MLTREGGDSKRRDVAVCEVSKQKGQPGKRRLVEAVVDSGAEESVSPPGEFPGQVLPSAMSKTGRHYRAANGTRIPNLGQQDAHFKTEEGHVCGLPFQVADVERPLIAVSQLAAAGNKVTLEDKGGVIVNNKTGKTIALQRRGGVYILRMWVASGANGASGFLRQGKKE